MRIDAHHYLTAGHPIEHLAPILERNRFEGSVWVVDPTVRDLTPADHPFVQAMIVDWERRSLDHPKIRGVWCDLASGIPEGYWPWARRRSNQALDLKLRPEHLPLASRIADLTPDVRLVLDDLASPPFGELNEEWARGMDAASRRPQIYCKASGLVTNGRQHWNAAEIRPYVQFVLKLFGPKRVLFGSGWPDCLPEFTWKETLAAFTQSIGAQPMETRELLLGENARKVYVLDRAMAALPDSVWRKRSDSTTTN